MLPDSEPLFFHLSCHRWDNKCIFISVCKQNAEDLELDKLSFMAFWGKGWTRWKPLGNKPHRCWELKVRDLFLQMACSFLLGYKLLPVCRDSLLYFNLSLFIYTIEESFPVSKFVGNAWSCVLWMLLSSVPCAGPDLQYVFIMDWMFLFSKIHMLKP